MRPSRNPLALAPLTMVPLMMAALVLGTLLSVGRVCPLSVCRGQSSGDDPPVPPAEEILDEELALERSLAEKLAALRVSDFPWSTTLSEAREIATEESSPILAYFTRSDVECPPCLELEEALVARDRWVGATSGAVLYLNVSSGLGLKADQELHADLGLLSFPSIVVLDPMGELLERVEIMAPLDPALLEESLEGALKRAVESCEIIVEARESKDPVARANLVLLETRLGRGVVDLSVLDDALAVNGTRPELRAWCAEERRMIPVREALGARRTRDAEARERAGEALLVLYLQKNRILDPDNPLFAEYWNAVFDVVFAENGDVEMAAQVHAEFAKQSTDEYKVLARTMKRRLAEAEISGGPEELEVAPEAGSPDASSPGGTPEEDTGEEKP